MNEDNRLIELTLLDEKLKIVALVKCLYSTVADANAVYYNGELYNYLSGNIIRGASFGRVTKTVDISPSSYSDVVAKSGEVKIKIEGPSASGKEHIKRRIVAALNVPEIAIHAVDNAEGVLITLNRL